MPPSPDSSPTDNLPIPSQPSSINLPNTEYFHDRLHQCFATIPVGDHMETWPINSKTFKHLVVGLIYKTYGKVPKSTELKNFLSHLAAQAQYDGPQHDVHVRMAHTDGKIYVDLANAQWQAVEITPTGWQVVDNPPVKFWRPQTLSAHPIPMPGGRLDDLQPFINCREDDWPLVVGWILGAFHSGSYPVMVLQGEHGTAKSTTAKILKTIVDPDMAPLLTKPKSERDLLIAANNSWCLSYDNFSGITDGLSDALCRLATGGGMRLRKLFSDAEETIFNVKRPVILNGIDSLVRRGDLADRAILLELPRIKDEDRFLESDLRQSLDDWLPGILGALFTALAAALANIHKVNLARPPRMADFATWVVAAEPALPWEPGTFLAAYEQNRGGVVERSLEADPVAMAVIELLSRASLIRDTWEGPATILLQVLKSIAEGPGGSGGTTGKDWPKAANILSASLHRLAPFFRKKGIEIEFGYTSKGRKITLRKVS